MGFCGPFDRALAESGAPAVFLVDHEGTWRFDADWTRDAWHRCTTRPGGAEPRVGRGYVLARDRTTGWVMLLLVSSPDLLRDHPRLDVRWYEALGPAREALDALGRPPIAREPW